MEKKDKQPGRTCIVSLGDGHSEYTINSTTYIVQCKYQKTTFTEKNRTFAAAIFLRRKFFVFRRTSYAVLRLRGEDRKIIMTIAMMIQDRYIIRKPLKSVTTSP